MEQTTRSGSASRGGAGLRGALGSALRDALIITAACAAIAVGINRFHPEGIPLVAKQRYETLVPCPEPGGPVTPMPADDARLTTASTFIVDARTAEAFKRWHFGNAMNVTFDYLDPTPKDVLARLAKRAAASRAQRVAVYGDGDDPDSGEQLGKELSLTGIKNVFFVQGGARALRASAGSRR